MADVSLRPGSRPRRLATISRQSLTTSFIWYFPSAVNSRAELTNCRLSTKSLTPTHLDSPVIATGPRYIAPARTAQKTFLLSTCATWHHVSNVALLPRVGPRRKHHYLQLFHCCMTSPLPRRRCLPCRCLATDYCLVAPSRLLCRNLATDNSFRLTWHNTKTFSATMTSTRTYHRYLFSRKLISTY
jgi:hypothetical protein